MSKASNKAYDTIKVSIFSGRLAPGTRLKEEELGELCGVSRTPIREALRRLHQEGLVQFLPHKGAHVCEWTDDDLEEIFALRAVLEGHAAERAAQFIQPKALARLEELASKMEHIIAGRGDDFETDFIAANQAFHATILKAAKSPRLERMLVHVLDQPVMYRTLRKYSEDDITRSMAHHRELIEAFRGRNIAWARAVMHCHINAAYSAMMRQNRTDDAAEVVPFRARS